MVFDMYNVELKERYIASLKAESSKTSVKYLFKKSEDLEREYEKDLYQFTLDEMQILISRFSPRKLSRQSRIASIRAYLRWATADGLDVVISKLKDINDTSEVAGEDNFAAKFVFSPQHLSTYLDSVFDDVELQTIDLTFRAFLWMSFMGVPQNMIERVSIRNVDLDEGFLVVGGEYYPLYKESVRTFYLLKNIDSFRYIHPLYDSLVYKPRIDSDVLIRGIKTAKKESPGEHVRRHQISTDVRGKIRKAIAKNPSIISLTYSNAKLSGVFYKMYLREESGIDVNFWSSAAKIVAENGEEDLKSTNAQHKINKIKLAMAKEYIVWKKAKQDYENSLR